MTDAQRTRKRKKLWKKRRRRRRLWQFCKIAILMGIIVYLMKYGIQKIDMPFSVFSSGKNYVVGIPEKRTSEEIYQKLGEMAHSDKDIKRIYINKEEYPLELLAGVVNNPEMVSFAKGYLTASGEKNDRFTKKEGKGEHPLLLQWDKRWGYCSYGGSVIGLSGCGPTCLSMVILDLTGDKTATPNAIAQFSEENGYYVEGTGTSWALMTDVSSGYGVTARELSLSENVMKQELDAGHRIICAVGPGDFTTAGHYIVIYGYDRDGFQVNDPNCIARSKKSWSYDRISSQIKNLWCYQV